MQSFSGTVFDFDAVSDNDTVYLVKGGIYQSDPGVVYRIADNKVLKKDKHGQIKPRKGETSVRLKKGDEVKTVTVKVEKIRKKTFKLPLNKDVSLDRIFRGLTESMPDIRDGRYSIRVLMPKVECLTYNSYVDIDASKGNSLSQFTLSSNGVPGKAQVVAVFGGKSYKAKIIVK